MSIALNDHIAWLRRAGLHTEAVSRSLLAPMTTLQIANIAKQTAPKLGRREALRALKKLLVRELDRCLNPDDRTGRLWYWTRTGRVAAKESFGVSAPPLPRRIDWYSVGTIARSSVLRAVLPALARRRNGLIASEVRLKLPTSTSVADVAQALLKLQDMGFVDSERVRRFRRRELNEYRVSELGLRVSSLLPQE